MAKRKSVTAESLLPSPMRELSELAEEYQHVQFPITQLIAGMRLRASSQCQDEAFIEMVGKREPRKLDEAEYQAEKARLQRLRELLGTIEARLDQEWTKPLNNEGKEGSK